MEKDPSLKTHEAYEKATQEWIKRHEKPAVVSEFPKALKDLPLPATRQKIR